MKSPRIAGTPANRHRAQNRRQRRRLLLENLEDRRVLATFFQGFEADNAGWNAFDGDDAVRVSSGTNGVTSSVGGWHAEVTGGPTASPTTSNGSTFTRWGGYSSVFPAGGYTTQVDIYLDTSVAAANDTRFDFSSAISTPAGGHRRDFVITGGFYNDSDATGSGPRYVFSTSNNVVGWPKNAARSPYTINTTGWYTLQHSFYDAGGGVLAVDMSILDSSGNVLTTWTNSNPTDIIGSTVGGNRYGWWANNQLNFLPMDNSFQTANTVYVDDDWAGTALGDDPDGAGPATAFGFDAFATIEDGVNSITTPGTLTVHVAAGTYNEDLTITNRVSILGPNAGLAGTDGSRGAEAVVNGEWTVNTSSPVSIDGLKFVNDNPSRSDTIFLLAGGTGSGHVITNNVFESTVAGGSTGGIHDVAVRLATIASGSITVSNNLMAGDSSFSATDKYSTAAWGRGVWSDGGGVTILIDGNTMENTRSAINLDQYDNATTTVSTNTIRHAGSGISLGIPVSANITTITGNTFDDVDLDFNLRNPSIGFSFDLNATGNSAPPGDVITLAGDKGMSSFTGTAGADVLTGDDPFDAPGNGAADTLNGLAGEDILVGGEGDDIIDGGSDNDTSRYNGNIGDYSFTPVIMGGVIVGYSSVTDNNPADGDEGTDTLTSIERLEFDDITLDAGNVTVNGTSNDDTLVFRQRAGGGFEYSLNGAPFVALPASISSFTFNGGDGDDSLTADWINGMPIPTGGLAFNGGTNASTDPGDQLFLTGGSVTTTHYYFDSESAGSVEVDGRVITYTGLEPVTDNLDAADRVFSFTSSMDEVITLDASGALDNRIDSTQGELVDFTNPTSSLTINTQTGGGAGLDTVHVEGLDAAFNADLTIVAGNDDAVNFQTAATGIGGGSATVDAGTVQVLAGGSLTSGTAIDLTAGDSILLNGPLVAANLVLLAATTGGIAGTATATAPQLSATAGQSISLNTVVGTVSAEAGGAIVIENDGPLTVGSVGPTSGVMAGAAVAITSADIDVQQAIQSTGGGNVDLASNNMTRTFAIGGGPAVKSSGITTGSAAYALDDAELDLVSTSGLRRVLGNGMVDQFNVNYDGSDSQAIHVLGLAGDDEFFVAPSTTAPLALDGGAPTTPALPGDTLRLDMSGAAAPVIVDTVGGYAVSQDTATISFTDIETLDLCDDSGDIENADMGDLYVRTTDNRERIVFTLWNDGGVKLRIDDFDAGTSSTFPQHFGLVGGMQMLQELLVYAQDGDDYVTVAGHVVNSMDQPIPVEFHGEEGNDYLAGANGDDVLVGGPGNDRLLAGEGNNVLIGDDIGGEAMTDGDDRLSSRDGDDVLLGGGGDDYLVSAGGNDVLDGGTGRDRMSGGLGDDILVGGAGADTLQGYHGNDVLLGGDDNDRIYGGYGEDLVVGGQGADLLRGDYDDDTLVAGTTSVDGFSFHPLAAVGAPPTHNANGLALLQLLSDWVGSGDDSGLGSLADDGDIDTLYDTLGANTAKATGSDDRLYGNF